MPPLTQPSTRSTLGPRVRLGPRVAFYLQASIIVSFLAASSAPTPLYASYQAQWGFSPITVTVIFGVYAFVFLTALLTVGALSDHVGRPGSAGGGHPASRRCGDPRSGWKRYGGPPRAYAAGTVSPGSR